mmetsp:Transcript_4796/g.7160  ORF Transcript_4796/g.7160 Transcript_4796/m.7160 type:complete len:87 (-) Transcript_4796:432-692(-)
MLMIMDHFRAVAMLSMSSGRKEISPLLWYKLRKETTSLKLCGGRRSEDKAYYLHLDRLERKFELTILNRCRVAIIYLAPHITLCRF